MRQLFIIFIMLTASFLGVWTYKLNTPVNRPDEYDEGYSTDSGSWWTSTTIEVDDEWYLDPEIPLNYLPVPGEDELYMVVDDDGNITGYRKRTQQIDGSWVWEDVNPDIPDNYEAVEGLENVYKVTAEDGTVTYYKYIRNDDDTYAFVEVDSEGNYLNKDRDATTIDGKHVHITGNIYAYLDDNGVVIGYDNRVENEDGTYSWVDTTLPELTDISSLYDGTSLGSDLANSDAFSQSLDTSGYGLASSSGATDGGTTTYNIDITVNQDDSDAADAAGNSGSNTSSDSLASDTVDLSGGSTTVINNGDGTHTEVETITETKNEDGYTNTYQTYVKKTYDSAGNLVSTYSEGPYLTESTQNITQETDPVQADISLKQSTLEGEVTRVTGSYAYNTALESEVYALLNAQRASNALSSLTWSDTAYAIAQLRAADMAGYDTSDSSLPTYGTLVSMMAEYSVTSSCAGENLWKCTEHTADDIHTRFQALDSARETRMNNDATGYAIAIVEKNGYYYICEVIL